MSPGHREPRLYIRMLVSCSRARPLDEALTEGTIGAEEVPIEEEEVPAIPFGAVEEELLRAFGGDEE